MSEGPYSRVYWQFQDEFADIYGDDHLLATWLRLLVIADGAYPAAPTLPRGVKMAAIRRLEEVGVLTLLTGDRYRILGQEKERAKRSAAARVGGLASGRARSVERPFTDRPTVVNLAEQSRAEKSKAEQTRGSKDPAPLATLMPDVAARFGKAASHD